MRRSVVAPYIDGLLEEKRSLGYSYVFEEYLLNEFDNYCIEHSLQDPCYDREFLKDWLVRWGTESSSYHGQRISFVRQLSLYMNSLGIHCYIPVEKVAKETTVPYFFNSQERKVFFDVLDRDVPNTAAPCDWRMWNEYRVMFRLIYCCGLRNNEACCLRTQDADLSRGILTIIHSKGDKDRLVYLAEDVRLMLCDYVEYLKRELHYLPEWLFPARVGEGHVVKHTLDARFNRVWNKTEFANKTNRKPTVHSLRHSFVVDRMDSWLDQGVSYEQMLPYLSKYLGHSSVDDTMYYYHLSPKANRIIKDNDTVSKRIIPEAERYAV